MNDYQQRVRALMAVRQVFAARHVSRVGALVLKDEMATAGSQAGAETKLVGAELVLKADKAADRAMSADAAVQFAGIHLLTEEQLKSHGNVGQEEVVVIDPLDGTSTFWRQYNAKPGVPAGPWGNLVAVVRNGITQVGVVHQVALKQLFFAARGLGCCRLWGDEYDRWMAGDDTVLGEMWTIDAEPTPGLPLIIAKSASGKMEDADAIDHAELGLKIHHTKTLANERSEGCAVGNAVLLLWKLIDAYINVGGGVIWDLAAAGLCIQEAGGLVTDLDGNELVWNEIRKRVMWSVNSDVHERLLAVRRRK